MLIHQIAVLQRVCHHFLSQRTKSTAACFSGQIYQAKLHGSLTPEHLQQSGDTMHHHGVELLYLQTCPVRIMRAMPIPVREGRGDGWHAESLLDQGVHTGLHEGTGVPMTSWVMLGERIPSASRPTGHMPLMVL